MWSSYSSGVSLMWHLKRLIKKTFYDRQKCQLLEATLRSPKKTWVTEDSTWVVVKLTTGEGISSCFACHQGLCSNCRHFWFDCPDLPCQIRSVCSSSTMGKSLRPSRPGSQRPLLSCAVAEDVMMSFVTAEDL